VVTPQQRRVTGRHSRQEQRGQSKDSDRGGGEDILVVGGCY